MLVVHKCVSVSKWADVGQFSLDTAIRNDNFSTQTQHPTGGTTHNNKLIAPKKGLVDLVSGVTNHQHNNESPQQWMLCMWEQITV